eukprot:TRINITY_DN2474_c0_g8_i1.p1 TRINITY_DN2474_c0_g8~~TRINITY_DN2474_c0_g8_i1.p1  ORF type:complete len:538 (-),score=107.11 TRINITY_DN2474_c0_g8_i1:47-1660(-)
MDEQLGDFATIDENSQWAGTFGKDELRRAVPAVAILNLAFAGLAYALIKIQVWAHANERKSFALQAGLVGFVRMIDALVDGVTFFSTNLLFVSLVSFFNWGQSNMITKLFGFAVGLTLLLMAVVYFSESIPRWLYEGRYLPCSEDRRDGVYSESSRITTELVNAWFIGQWQWLMGFAWWNLLLATLGSEYLDLYHHTLAWWMLIVFILLVWGVTALLIPYLAYSQDRPAPPEHPLIYQRRLLPMFLKALRWVLGIGLFFTLRRQFSVFGNAIELAPVDVSELFGYCMAVTFISLMGVFLVEMAMRVTEQLRKAIGADSDAFCLCRGDLTQPHICSGSCVKAYQAYVTRLARWCLCSKLPCGYRGGDLYKGSSLLIVYGDEVDSTFRLAFGYLTGTAWRGFGFGVHHGRLTSGDDFLKVALLGTAVAAVLSTIGAVWSLKTERAHGEAHSDRCVCPVCAPEHFDPATVSFCEEYVARLHNNEPQYSRYRYRREKANPGVYQPRAEGEARGEDTGEGNEEGQAEGEGNVPLGGAAVMVI